MSTPHTSVTHELNPLRPIIMAMEILFFTLFHEISSGYENEPPRKPELGHTDCE